MNALRAVVPSPEQPVDWLRMWAVTLANTQRWRQHETLNAWLSQCRLNGVTAMLRGSKPDDTAKLERLKEVTAKGGAAAAKLPGLLASWRERHHDRHEPTAARPPA